ncbi:VTT domain-containing protein [Anaeromyxobacter sp. Red801]|uniref:VTT domain-containing protein n=1 Tax=Anaeromyxobacter sp. Red801 TaxID=3411632 RepID=UPI003BA17DDD
MIPGSPPPARLARLARPAAAVLLVAAVAALATLAPAPATRALEALRQSAPAAAAALAAAYVAGGPLMIPAPLLHLAAGFALGPVSGTLLAVPASTAGACAAFAAGRWLVRGRAARLAARSPALAGLDAALGASGFRVVLLLRLAPLAPFTVLNYLLGATPVPLRAFALASLLGSAPGLIVSVYVGSLAADAAALRATLDAGRGGAGALILPALGTGAVLLAISWVLRRSLAAASARPAIPPR